MCRLNILTWRWRLLVIFGIDKNRSFRSSFQHRLIFLRVSSKDTNYGKKVTFKGSCAVAAIISNIQMKEKHSSQWRELFFDRWATCTLDSVRKKTPPKRSQISTIVGTMDSRFTRNCRPSPTSARRVVVSMRWASAREADSATSCIWNPFRRTWSVNCMERGERKEGGAGNDTGTLVQWRNA